MNNFIAFRTIVTEEIRRFIRIWPQTLLPPVITTSLYFMIFAGTPVEAKKGGGGDVIDAVWAAITGLDTRVSELESSPHMVKTVKFNKLDGPINPPSQMPSELEYTTTAKQP